MLEPKRITKIRLFYSQHVLPLVYDYSLSFYEALCKIAGTLNDTIEAVEDIDGRVTENTTNITNLTEVVNNFDDRIQDAEDKADQAINGLADLTPIVNQHTITLQNHTTDLSDLETRVSLLEGYAGWGSLTPATTEDLDDMKTEIEDDVDGKLADIEDLIDALIQGGYTPKYGSVDFGLATLLRAAPTELDPDHMEIASQDFQVSASYVQALNMVYGCFYISMSEGATVNAIPGDTFVLCWKNSADLPAIAHDFPGVKVRWDTETHVPDVFKIGIDYNNTFTKRVDCFFTPNRDQYPDYLGNGYRWYAPVYLNNIDTGSPVTNWAIIQIPFCYLSLGAGGYTETDLYSIVSPVSRTSGEGVLDTAINLTGTDTLENTKGWGIEFNIHNMEESSSSGTNRSTWFMSGIANHTGAVQIQTSDSVSNQNKLQILGCTISGTSGNITWDNVIESGADYKLEYNSDRQTVTLYDGYGDIIRQSTETVFNPNTYAATSVLFGSISDVGSKAQKAVGTIDKFRFYKLT